MMKKIKTVLFGYSKEDVDSIIDSYENRLKTSAQDIAYLNEKVNRLEKLQKPQKENVSQLETLVAKDIVESNEKLQ